MKKLFLYVFVFFGLVQSCFADINKEKAVAMIENLTKEGIEEIVNSNKSVEEKNEVFRKLFTENLDLDFIGKYVFLAFLSRVYYNNCAKNTRDYGGRADSICSQNM